MIVREDFGKWELDDVVAVSRKADKSVVSEQTRGSLVDSRDHDDGRSEDGGSNLARGLLYLEGSGVGIHQSQLSHILAPAEQ